MVLHLKRLGSVYLIMLALVCAQEDEDDCDLSKVCLGSEDRNETGCLVGRFATCNNKCLSPQFPILVEAGVFYDFRELSHLAPVADNFEQLCVTVTCDLSRFFQMEPELRRSGPICLAPGMACNDTCSWVDTKSIKTSRNLRFFDELRRETVCVPFCQRESEWQCGDECVPRDQPCQGQCPRDTWLCKQENRCIPLRWVCDGSTNLGCLDGSDEEDCGSCADGLRSCGNKTLCSTELPGLPCDGQCPQGMQLCSTGSCVTHRQACNETCLREGYLRCGHQCYPASERCNGKANCADQSDEADCKDCSLGSKMCKNGNVICNDQECDEDQTVESLAISDEKTCLSRCDHFWCRSEKRCIYRNDPLQGCDDLRGFPSVDHAIFTNVSGPACDSGLWDGTVDGDGQIFKQASCLPDQDGNCPTSFRVSDHVTKLWIKCGPACWTKNVYHQEKEIPDRYRLKPGETSLAVEPKCHAESFPDLCLGRCKFYDAWFCDGQLICTDQPCKKQCPKSAGPEGLEFYYCQASGQCMPVTQPCQNKCQQGRFRCGSICLSPAQVCDGNKDCLNEEDENPKFCQGCAVGQTLCQGQPICKDQKCQGRCFEDPASEVKFADCQFEGSDRNICAQRLSLCDDWMERRHGQRFLDSVLVF